MSEGEFGGLNFPIIKDIVPRLSDDLISVQPMTTVEAAKGRPIKPYPVKYDDFRTADDLEEYVKMRLRETHCGLKLQASWLHISRSFDLPFNLWDDVFYEASSLILNITCHAPKKHPLDRPIGITVCQLNPEKWEPLGVESIIERIKKASDDELP